MFFSAVAKGCNHPVLGLEGKAVIQAREEAQDWQRYDTVRMIIVYFFTAWEVKTTTIQYCSSHAETEQHEDVVSRKQHIWFIHGLGLDQYVSNKRLVLHMLITSGVAGDFLCQEKANEQAKAKAFASAKMEAEEAAKEQI